MKEGKELYKQVELPAGMDVEPCPVCGADAELWQHSNDFNHGPIDKLVMCSNGDRFGPQDGAMNEGCLLYMPPQDFYRGRIAEAVKFWNQYARALNEQRRKRNLERAKVLREVTPNKGIEDAATAQPVAGMRDAFPAANAELRGAKPIGEASRSNDVLGAGRPRKETT